MSIFFSVPAEHVRRPNSLKVSFSDDTYARLSLHCDRLGLDRATFVQISAIERVRQLDAEEAHLAAQRALAKTPRAAAAPRGLSVEIKTKHAPVPVGAAPLKSPSIDKLRNSFRRLAEYIEGAEGQIDRTIRMQTAHDDFRERANKPEDADVAFTELQTFLSERAKLRPKEVVSAPLDVPVEGDVD